MKISASLIGTDIGNAIFKKSIEEFVDFLGTTFEFKRNDPSSCEYFKVNDAEYTVATRFDYNGRPLMASFSYEKAEDGVLQEAISIKEESESHHSIDASDYNDAVEKVHKMIYDLYDVDFLPLDPQEFNASVISVSEDPTLGTYKAIFKSPLYAGIVSVNYEFNPGKLSFISSIQHKIILG